MDSVFHSGVRGTHLIRTYVLIVVYVVYSQKSSYAIIRNPLGCTDTKEINSLRIRCLQENLQRALATAGRAVQTKTTLPVLGNYKLEANGDSLTISATDLEVGVVYSIPAQVEESGVITLQSRVLSDFVASLPAGEVELFEDQGPTTMLVKQGSTQAHVRGSEADEFPDIIPAATGENAIRVAPDVLDEAIELVAFAAASDDSRPVLAGVQLEVSGNSAKLSAADGFRMSVREFELLDNAAEDISIIVPARAMREMQRVLADEVDEVRLQITPNQSQLVVSVPDVTFVTRLIDGTFPDLDKIIPTEWSTRTVVSRDPLLIASRRAAIFARTNNDVIRFSITPADESEDVGRLRVSATAADTGDNRDDVDAQIEGEQLEVAFNGRYLTDYLSVLNDSSVSLELLGPNSAGVFKPVDDAHYIHVIMPMVIGAN